jgi:putative transposase
MLDAKAFRFYATRHGLTKDAIARIARVRSEPPSAGPTIGRGRPVRFASHKMGHSVSGDAYTTEGLALLSYELTDSVVEMWEQPLEITLSYTDRSGQVHGHRTRPDFLVLERAGAFLDEWKTEEELLALAEVQPSRYQRTEDGWRSPPAETAAALLGMTFRLRTTATIRPEIVQNGRFMRDYWRSNEVVSEEATEVLSEAVAERPGITIGELLRRCPQARPDDLYLLIARDQLYVNTAKHRLAETFYTPVFGSAILARAITGQSEAPWDGRGSREPLLAPGVDVELGGRTLKVVASTALSVTFRAEGGALLPLARDEAERRVAAGEISPVGTEAGLTSTIKTIRSAKGARLKEADRRVATLKLWWSGEAVDVNPRTLRRWRKSYQDEALRTGHGFPGLIPSQVGRPSGPGLGREMEELIATCIRESYEVKDPPTLGVFYEVVKAAFAAAGFGTPPSRTTIKDRVRHRDKGRALLTQAGSKMANQVKEFVSYLALDTPPHGERPFERGHLDHTQLDDFLIDSETGLVIGRPWLTLLIDAYSRRILAFYLTFDEPSYRSTMMVLRLCVKRWGRLPDELVVDDGAEFNSVYFERLLTHYSVEKLTRRGDPRVGGLIERFFGSLNTRLLHALRGQTRPTKNVRGMSREVDPRPRAVWTLAAIYPVLEEYFFDIYDTFMHPAFGASPRQVYETRMAVTGVRANSLIADDEVFFFMSLPTTAKGYAKVSYERGVKIGHYHYKAPELRFPGVAGNCIEVRYDPMDIRHAYGHVRGRWVELYCPSLRRFPPVGEREVAAISAELAERPRKTARAQEVNGERLAEFLSKTKATEPVLLQRRRDAQLRAVASAHEGLAAVVGVTASDDASLASTAIPEVAADAAKPRERPSSRRAAPPPPPLLPVFPSYE